MRYFIEFKYDGSNFNGYQKQPNKRTVQEEIEKVINQITNESVVISASGRTDAKVHAKGQCAHFDLNKKIDLNKFKYSMNSLLPKDIYIKNIKKINKEFHARYDVSEKIYEYKINIGEYNPMDRNYIYQYNKKLNIQDMKEAIKNYIGIHNFKSFTKNNPKITNYEREIYEATISEKNNIITIKFRGNGFLQYMVRNMVGLLIEIGNGKKKINSVKEILKKEDRKEAGVMAPGCGLYLKKVYYKQKDKNMIK